MHETVAQDTVTFVVTDIEGSTRLLHTLGDRYRQALEQHRTILREAFTTFGGTEVDTRGSRWEWRGAASLAGRDGSRCRSHGSRL